MALILNLETATTNCSVSLGRDGKLLAIKEHDSPGYSHSEQLHVFIKEVMSMASLDLSALEAVAVSKGPGSYTGLRIGVSAAKGLCFALDIPLISVATLESMAHQVSKDAADVIIPVLDARRMEVYSAIFDNYMKQLRETKAEIINENSFGEFTKIGKVLLLGSGAEKCRELLPSPNFIFNTTMVPSAKEMVPLSYAKFCTKDFEDMAYFEPYYLKDFMITKKQKEN